MILFGRGFQPVRRVFIPKPDGRQEIRTISRLRLHGLIERMPKAHDVSLRGQRCCRSQQISHPR